MDQGMFNRFNVVNYFIAMTVALSICGFVAGLVSTWMILTTLETLGLTFGDAAVLVTIPVGCAVCSALMMVSERKKFEREANWKVEVLMFMLERQKKLTAQEAQDALKGMRSVQLADE